jgi:hypothetical protein
VSEVSELKEAVDIIAELLYRSTELMPEKVSNVKDGRYCCIKCGGCGFMSLMGEYIQSEHGGDARDKQAKDCVRIKAEKWIARHGGKPTQDYPVYDRGSWTD